MVKKKPKIKSKDKDIEHSDSIGLFGHIMNLLKICMFASIIVIGCMLIVMPPDMTPYHDKVYEFTSDSGDTVVCSHYSFQKNHVYYYGCDDGYEYNIFDDRTVKEYWR